MSERLSLPPRHTWGGRGKYHRERVKFRNVETNKNIEEQFIGKNIY